LSTKGKYKGLVLQAQIRLRDVALKRSILLVLQITVVLIMSTSLEIHRCEDV
jgi:hypothetical protein